MSGEWGTPEFYVEELRAVRDALAPSKASGVCNGAAMTIEKLMRRAAPSEPASEPEYDRSLIAVMLDHLTTGRLGGFTPAAIRKQADLLRAADNAHEARTVNRSEPASGEAGLIAWWWQRLPNMEPGAAAMCEELLRSLGKINSASPPASIPAAEVLALVEKWRNRKKDIGSPEASNEVDRCADELAALLKRGT